MIKTETLQLELILNIEIEKTFKKKPVKNSIPSRFLTSLHQIIVEIKCCFWVYSYLPIWTYWWCYGALLNSLSKKLYWRKKLAIRLYTTKSSIYIKLFRLLKCFFQTKSLGALHIPDAFWIFFHNYCACGVGTDFCCWILFIFLWIAHIS